MPKALISRLLLPSLLLPATACRDPETGWPIQDPPSPPKHLKSLDEIRPLAAAAMPAAKPTFGWPENLALEVATTVEQRSDSQRWLWRRATLETTKKAVVTPTSVGPIVSFEDLSFQRVDGSATLLREALREVAVDGHLSFRVKNDGSFGRVASAEASVAAATETLDEASIARDRPSEPRAPVTVEEIQERAQAVWSAWVQNALGLVGSPTAGWCGAAKAPPLFVETEQTGTACLALTAPSQCLIEGQTSACFLVEYALEIEPEEKEGETSAAPDAAEAPADAPPAGTEAETDVVADTDAGGESDGAGTAARVTHQSRARVLLAMENLVPVKVEVWRLTDAVEPGPEGTDVRSWKSRYSVTRFRRVEGPPEGTAREKLRASCEAGTAVDCMELGIMIGTGKDGPKDLAEARGWVKKACALEDASACEFLEVMAVAPDAEAAPAEEAAAPPEGEPSP